MTLPIFIALDREIPNFDAFVQAQHLADEFALVNIVAKKAGLKPLASYMGQSSDDFEEIFGEDVTDEESDDEAVPDGSFLDCLDELPEGEDTVWFDATEGVRFVDALIEAVRVYHSEFAHGEAIAEDLLSFRRVLGRAMAIGAEWHFAV